MPRSAVEQTFFQTTSDDNRTLINTFPAALATDVAHTRGWDLGFVFLVALLGLYGGTPYDHPDFLTAFVGNVFRTGGNPKFFHYGCLIIYALCVVYGVTFVLLRLLGIVHTVGDFQKLIDTGYFIERPIKVSAFFPGHLFTVLCSVLALYSVFWLALRITGRRKWAYVAVLFLGTSYQWVADSHFLTVDVPMAALLITTIALAFALADRLSPMAYAIAMGACSGFVAGAKYPGGLVAIPLFAVCVLFAPRHQSRLTLALVFPIAALFTFLLSNPFILLDFQTFLNDFRMEMVHARGGHDGFMSTSFFFHTKVSLRNSVGILGLGLALVGIVLCLASRVLSLRVKILLLAYPLLQFLLVSSSALAFQRYVTPLLPFIAIFCAIALAAVEGAISCQSIKRTFNPVRTFIALTLGALVIVPNTALAARTGALLQGLDSRQVFVELIKDQPIGSFYVSNYLKYYFRHYTKDPAAGDEINALFLDNFTYDRDLYEECRVDPEMLPLFSKFDRVLIINPFNQPKERVPFSPQSTFAPALPDLPLRKVAGPYIEVYFSSTGPLAAKWDSLQLDLVSVLPATAGYYYRELPPKCVNVKNRERLDIEKFGYRSRHSTKM